MAAYVIATAGVTGPVRDEKSERIAARRARRNAAEGTLSAVSA